MRLKLIALIAVTVVTLGWAVHAAGTPFADQVKVEGGTIKGAVADGVLSFKGIPFAAPPQGDLRWRPPQPVVAWTGVRPATAYGHDCMQKPFGGDAAPLGTEPAEDCLVVNVWRPAEKGAAKLPVMVWIYGGGFVNGGSSPAVYDGSQFAKHGIVFVSFNYRLGRFGFFAHPALSAGGPGGPLGNYGFMDTIAAMKWVKNNAAAFGGDPANVTVVRRIGRRHAGAHAADLAGCEGPGAQGDHRVGRRPQRHLPVRASCTRTRRTARRRLNRWAWRSRRASASRAPTPPRWPPCARCRPTR